MNRARTALLSRRHYHGALLCLYRRFSAVWEGIPRGVRRVAMLLLVVIGWVFFRATDLAMARSMLSAMFTPRAGTTRDGLPLLIGLLLAAGWSGVAGPNAFEMHEAFRWRRRRGFALAAAFGSCAALIARPVAYFQF